MAKHGANISDIVKVYQLIINIQNLVDKIQNDQYDQHPQYGEQVRRYILDPIVEVLEQVQPLEGMIQKAVDLDKAKNNEYQVNPRFSESLTDIYKNINSTKKKITQLAEETSNDLGIAVKLVDATTHYFLFEAKKKEADDAFRKKNSKKYKTISVKKNNITFTSIDLQGECAELQSLEEEYQSESQEVVQRLLTVVATYYPAMEQSSSIISELDVFCTFANIAVNSNQYVKPKINSQIETIKLIDSKHACLDARESNCIANDCVMNKEDSRFHIITGPNMGGKSTYIRQVAICTLLAHIGCYVPAKSAEFPIIDAIISRVGASDMQLRGISTFMSEMLEAACMIKIATEKSLIIIDELGRGTSTSEGFGLAWAISEYIVKQIKCYCLFATHFHEMIKMEDQIQGVKNYHVTCLAKNNKLNFQYRVKEGYAERSYGLYVAELLDFPEQIMSDAAQKLAELENFAGETSSQNNENQQQGDIMIDENLDYNNIDIFQLSKNATKEQREKVIQIAQKYTIQLQKANQIQQQEIMEELKKQVVNVLSLNN
ncbi:P-loop containing nucleoside triphosphate hydrolase [Pseudocohnilembus persalinus]|uniref:p-loop containing nucleoside triphosphate hydrolase n=1 Tax=Pseudocohnilembus persalinus TaxID=266149 RepID=A0A0V0R0E1_PSEPJ|nr:P-loop containing nucleoside triphosphate hydrolase [Pseudocohnilembus persalinus]|eukprot:KRX07821.1 P-loop containing nucleoside triphosphate hydrolase [Pseudocohnilembus persalinus]